LREFHSDGVATRAGDTLPPIRFGTDGWRARIAHDFTFASLERAAQAYATFLKHEHAEAFANRPSPNDTTNSSITDKQKQCVVVGYDRRFLSEEFARRTSEVLRGNDFNVLLFSEDVPTQLVSWAVRELGARGGICITASHNPPQFNGFKIKAPWGGSAAPETTAAIETLVDAEPVRRASSPSGTSPNTSTGELSACTESYRRAVAAYVDIERLRATPSRIVIDSMHGSGGHWLEGFLRGGNIKAETIRANRDPLFGGVNPEPIDLNLGALKNRVRETNALVGLATDGDADRLGAVNDAGETMTMHEVVPLILLHLARNRGMTGGVVRTFSQSVLTRRIAAAHNLPLYDTPIGFKYIAELMLREDILIGAEESGGIGVRGHIPERDGILNSLLLLEAIVTAGKSPTQMVKEMHTEFGEFYFGRIDLHQEVSHGQALVRRLAEHSPANIGGYEVADVLTTDGTKLLFADESWLLFRQSGTEPALRIYAEATSTHKMRELLEAGRKLAT